MANGDQIKAMLRAYKESDETQLLTLALQIAAREAKAGHGKLATEIRDLVDELKNNSPIVSRRTPTPIAQPKGELAELVTVDYPEVRLDDLVLDLDNRQRFDRLILEQRQSAKILEHGLNPRRKLLLVGPPGIGKTMSAAAIAGELSLPLFTLRLESLFTKEELSSYIDYTASCATMSTKRGFWRRPPRTRKSPLRWASKATARKASASSANGFGPAPSAKCARWTLGAAFPITRGVRPTGVPNTARAGPRISCRSRTN